MAKEVCNACVISTKLPNVFCYKVALAQVLKLFRFASKLELPQLNVYKLCAYEPNSYKQTINKAKEVCETLFVSY